LQEHRLHLHVLPCIRDRAPTSPGRNKCLSLIRKQKRSMTCREHGLTTEPCVAIIGATAPLSFRHVVVKGDPDFLLCKLGCYSIEDLGEELE
jgi:hypothetical protein